MQINPTNPNEAAQANPQTAAQPNAAQNAQTAQAGNAPLTEDRVRAIVAEELKKQGR